VIGSIFAARYRTLMTLPAAVPAQASEAAKDSIGKALAVANRLPEPLSTAVHDASVHAFVGSMRTAVAIGAVVLAIAVAVAWKFLPAHEAPAHDEELDAAARELASIDDGVYV